MVWILCAILTATVSLPKGAQSIRTDLKMDGFAKAAWFRVPYPFQWGIPTFSVASVVGMIAGNLILIKKFLFLGHLVRWSVSHVFGGVLQVIPIILWLLPNNGIVIKTRLYSLINVTGA